MNKLGLGALGERMAQEYLRRHGYKIIAKNCIFAGAELDIVAIYPVKAQKKELLKNYKTSKNISKSSYKILSKQLEDILCFVEVKYSSTRVFGEPEERVDSHKQRQIIRAAELFILKNKFNLDCRFDVVSVVGDEVKHIINAFEA